MINCNFVNKFLVTICLSICLNLLLSVQTMCAETTSVNVVNRNVINKIVMSNSVGTANSLPNWLKQQPINKGKGRNNLGFNILLALLLVIFLILGIFSLLKLGFTKNFRGTQSSIKLINRYYLSPKCFICVVEVDGNRYLLGVGDNVSVLGNLGQDKRFVGLVQEEMAKFNNDKAGEYVDFIKEVNSQIQELKQALRRKMS